jgi:S-adenosylmethionine hydrolase
MERLGPATRRYARLSIQGPEATEDRAVTRIRWIDRFGNLITDCPAGMLDELSGRWGGISINLGTHGMAPVVSAYEDVGRGRLLAIVGSSGYLEISIREGSAARTLDFGLGDTLTLRKP